MSHNSTATTPHNSDTAYNSTEEFNSTTPESRVKDLGGTVKHFKFYTVAMFNDNVAAEYFYSWVSSKDNYEVVTFNTSTIAYRHKTVSPQKN